jgi:hypothetical protein
MGLAFFLEDEHGNILETLSAELTFDLWNEIDFKDFVLLKYVDPYGDVVFNSLQMPDLIVDLEKLARLLPTKSVGIQDAVDLVKRSKNLVHTYIRIVGD